MRSPRVAGRSRVRHVPLELQPRVVQDAPDDVFVKRLGEVPELGEERARVRTARDGPGRSSRRGGPTRAARLLHRRPRASELQQERRARVVTVGARLRDDQRERPRGLDGESEPGQRVESRRAFTRRLGTDAGIAPNRPPPSAHRARVSGIGDERRRDVDGDVARIR